MSIKVSVIVPVYNPGTGIRRCVQSLVNQTLKEIELIFIDDCGTDHAMSVVEGAAKCDKRIRIIRNPQNMGSGPSRNRGIEEAAGEYLSFVDPDDYVFTDFLERLYRKGEATGSDIVKGTLRSSVSKNGKEKINPPTTLNLRIKKGLKKGRPLYSLFYLEHPTAIYRTSTVKKHSVRYGLSSNAEDIVFLLRMCYGRRKIAFEERAVYVYAVREDSNNRKATLKRLQGEIQSLKEILEFLEHHCEDTDKGYMFASNLVVKILEVQKVIAQDPKMRKEMAEAGKNMHSILSECCILPGLKKTSMVIGAFADFDINLSALPYSRYWYEGPYSVYKEQIVTWVDFLRAHPAYRGECQPALWRTFESAIVFDDWSNEKEFTRRTEMKEIRRQAHRLPDRKVLTDNYISMKLFIDYGINTFGLRESLIGNIAKRAAVLLR